MTHQFKRHKTKSIYKFKYQVPLNQSHNQESSCHKAECKPVIVFTVICKDRCALLSPQLKTANKKQCRCVNKRHVFKMDTSETETF